jgi:DNA-binding NtrC family response regulator
MVQIHLPRLADRKEDRPFLQKHFVEKSAVQYGKQIKGITRRAQLPFARKQPQVRMGPWNR